MLTRIICCLLLLWAVPAAAYDFDWLYKTQLTVTSTVAHTNYYVKLELDSSDLYSGYTWSDDGADLRIVDSDNSTELDFYIESWSSSGSAVVWVIIPTLTANTAHTLYLYYGNTEADSAASADAPTTSGIYYHTRYSTTDPSSLATARSAFLASNDSTTGYGSTMLSDFTSVANSTAITSGATTNFILYSLSTFTVTSAEAGTWYFRAGVDFGRGGALYVDGVAIEEQWSTDMWWEETWPTGNGTNILYGSSTLSAGQHTLMLMGAENSNGGVMTVQYKPGSSASWTAYSTANLTITSFSQYRDASDPTVTVVSSGRNLTTGVDLVVSVDPESVNWLYGSGETVSVVISVDNMGTQTLTSTVSLSFTLGSGLSVQSVSGTGWSCSSRGNSYTCTNSTDIASAGSLSDLTLVISVGTNISAGSSRTYSVTGSLTNSGGQPGGGSSSQTDADSSNNTASGTIYIIEADFMLDASGTSDCDYALTSGLWSRFFDTTNYGYTFAASASAFQTVVDTYSTSTYLLGQTLLSTINESDNGNPFDDAEDSGDYESYFLALMEGYLYVAEDGVYGISPDGDDIVEIWLDDELITGIYGNHGGVEGAGTYSADVWMEAGYHKLEFRHQQVSYGQARYLYWDSGDGWEIVPASSLYQCGGVSELSLTSTVSVVNDPVNGSSSPKAIPGAVVEVDVEASNTGTLSSDPQSTVLIQAIDSNSVFYTGTDSSTSPVTFTDGSGNSASGLTFSFSSLTDTSDSLDFSNDGGSSFDYSPSPDSDGYDANITDFRLTLSGSLKPATSELSPAFGYSYQVQLQ